MTEKPGFAAIRQVAQLPGGFVAGFTYPLQALKLLSQNSPLWGCVVFPILVNLVLGVILYAGLTIPGWHAIDTWTAGLPVWATQWVSSLPVWAARVLGWLPSWAAFLDDVLRWLFAIALFILTGLLLVQFGAIFGAPWYGSLAEQIEKLRLGQLPTANQSLGRALEDIGRAIAFQLKKLLLMVVLGVPLFLLNFVPVPIVSNTIATIAGVALASLLVGMDFLDPPLERRRLSFRHKLAIFGRSLPASASFSWVCLILVSIPLLNLLVVPLCVVAGTLFCCDRVLPYLPSNHQPKS